MRGRAFAFSVDDNPVILFQLAHKHLLGNRVFNVSLNDSTQRSGSQKRLKAFLCEQIFRFVGNVDNHVTLEYAVVNLLNFNIDNLANLRLGQLSEHDNVVQTVEEFGAEMFFKFSRNLLFHILISDFRVCSKTETGVCGFRNILASQIGRKNNNSVLEIDFASASVGQMTVVQNLQKRVEHVRMRFFNLIKKHD